MSDVDQLAATIDAMISKLDAIAPWRDARPVTIVYNPRNIGPRPSDGGPEDPWCAWIGTLRGTGQTIEMALLDLKADIEKDMRLTIQSAREKMAETSAQLDEMAAILRTPETGSEG